LVAQVKVAAEMAGLFHLVNHGIPGELMSEMLSSVRRFHEALPEAKRPYYTHDPGRKRERGGPAPVERSTAAGGREGGRHGARRAPRRGGGRRAEMGSAGTGGRREARGSAGDGAAARQGGGERRGRAGAWDKEQSQLMRRET
jgi:hypothetical protein